MSHLLVRKKKKAPLQNVTCAGTSSTNPSSPVASKVQTAACWQNNIWCEWSLLFHPETSLHAAAFTPPTFAPTSCEYPEIQVKTLLGERLWSGWQGTIWEALSWNYWVKRAALNDHSIAQPRSHWCCAIVTYLLPTLHDIHITVHIKDHRECIKWVGHVNSTCESTPDAVRIHPRCDMQVTVAASGPGLSVTIATSSVLKCSTMQSQVAASTEAGTDKYHQY